MPSQVTIKDTRRLMSRDPARAGKFDRVIIYQREDKTGDMVILPDEACDDKAITAAIIAHEKTAKGLVGKTLTI